MKLNKILTAALLTGSLAIGTVGIASAASAADTPSTSTPGSTSTPRSKPTQEQLCSRAQQVWQRLKNLDERARAHQQKLTALRDDAAAAGNTELVAKIDARLARLQERHDRIVARLEEIHDKSEGRCAEPASATS